MNIKSNWNEFIQEEMKKDYFLEIKKMLKEQESDEKIIYPPKDKIFEAFNVSDIENIKVVIIGQDPYHNKNQANGMSFSVAKGNKIPPSLKNIYKELKLEYKEIEIPEHGDLTAWAKQGVFLLNNVLTVEEHKPDSHKKIGWEIFTDNVIKYLNKTQNNVVYILWGKNAEKKELLIDKENNLVLKSAHPSPFSANRGFFGCNHFIKTNEYLKKHEKSVINWEIK